MGFLSNLLFGTDTRDSENARNWQAVNDARGDYAAAQAYQSYYKNLKENDPDTYNKIASAYDMSGIESDSFLDPYSSAVSEATNTFKDRFKHNRYNEFGNGIIGSLINPVGQVASLGGDLLYGAGTGDWSNAAKRDYVSDLGALANTALTFTGVGNLARTAPLASKIAAGAAMGGAQNAAFNLWQNGSDAQIGDVLGDAAFGAAIGGAIPIAGNAIGNITQRGAVKNVNNALRNAGFGSNLDNAGMYAAGQNVLGDQYQSLLDQANSGVRNKLTNFATGALPNSRLGKMAAIGGGTALGGYGLSKLFGGNNTQQMINDIKLGGEYLSDEDLAALYNYYGIGG